jgi:hypothetical protein
MTPVAQGIGGLNRAAVKFGYSDHLIYLFPSSDLFAFITITRPPRRTMEEKKAGYHAP